FSRIKISILPF
ncbi:hypothetical protein CP03DC29_1007B, partial [Chlamydia psittaci 03DC29]